MSSEEEQKISKFGTAPPPPKKSTVPDAPSDVLFYDIIVFGGGIAGLWLTNVLKRAGYNVILIEKDALGGTQTLASQGMIHGGQKYTLEGAVTDHAASIARMPERWEACLGGYGEVDLTLVNYLSDHQVMWPAGSLLADIAVFGAAKLVNAQTVKLKQPEIPEALKAPGKKFKGAVYSMPEKVLDTRSLVAALAAPLAGRLFKGTVTEILPDGQAAVDGVVMQAQMLVFTAGIGNEDAFKMLRIEKQLTQRRPLRQIMVRPMPDALHGHGIVGKPKPRLTVTSHPNGRDGYVWYIGGNVAEESAAMSEDAALQFAKSELEAVFPHIDWTNKQWATWQGDRAEPYDETGHLPPGPFAQQRGRVMVAWPTKLTFAPALADRLFDKLRERKLEPVYKTEPPADKFPVAEIGRHPWETAAWRKI
ncbi:MAG: FAD-dependent oxidoreductase [Bdellovibrionales bacterium]|jgi:glycine/D-amino acid oxidase-like deaminating enzyme|nr:FAD-dependent oxidoreductase [Bdellovibrionales bacterium]